MSATAHAWLDRPAGRWAAAALVALVLAAPAWLMADTLGNYALFGDDFYYMAASRDLPSLLAHLARPHNTHIVPLFRLWNAALFAIAGRVSALPSVLGWGAYGALVAAMLAGGRLVARETGRPALALAAMALLGTTSVMEPSVAWYSAGQAIWAGVAILATLLAVRGWRVRGGAWRLALAWLGTVAALATWSGGLAAGPAAAAALWADGRPRCRRAALLFLGATAASALLVVGLSRRQIADTRIIWEQHSEVLPRPVQAVLHTSQAIPEALVLNNLGLDAETTAGQGVVLTLALAAAWRWSRRAAPRPNPLEAAGAAVVAFSFLMVYFFRGNLPFSSLREVAWYFAIPHIGAVLFAAGWWSGAPADAPTPRPLTRRGALVIPALVAALLMLHVPRLQRRMIEQAPPLSATERWLFRIPELRYSRARYVASVQADRQRRAFARLDRVPAIAARLGIGRAAIRRVFGRVVVPGVPEKAEHFSAVDLLVLPERGPESDPARIRAALGDYLAPEPVRRPPWLAPEDPWPPPPYEPPMKPPAFRIEDVSH